MRLTEVELEEIRGSFQGVVAHDFDGSAYANLLLEKGRKLLNELDALKAELAAARAERDEARELCRHSWETQRPVKPYTQWGHR